MPKVKRKEVLPPDHMIRLWEKRSGLPLLSFKLNVELKGKVNQFRRVWRDSGANESQVVELSSGDKFKLSSGDVSYQVFIERVE